VNKLSREQTQQRTSIECVGMHMHIVEHV